MNFAGIPISFSVHCTSTERVRVHVKRNTQREAYHQRIDKKWKKRFGTKQVPAFYMLAGSRIVAHPALKEKLLAALERQA